jgi:hypothetical protein
MRHVAVGEPLDASADVLHRFLDDYLVAGASEVSAE